MRRNKFLKTCGFGCLGLFGAFSLLEGCAGTKYMNGALVGSFLEVPIKAFESIKKNETTFRKYIVVQNPALQYPICVYRSSASEYRALLMKCTHQGTELDVYGDRLQCPAHGSEFTKTGAVQNGPADSNLRSFPVKIENNTLKINLA